MSDKDDEILERMELIDNLLERAAQLSGDNAHDLQHTPTGKDITLSTSILSLAASLFKARQASVKNISIFKRRKAKHE